MTVGRVDDVYIERVLRAVELVPAGRVVSYGDIAALAGRGPRLVARVLSQWSGGVVPWWRVVRATGEIAEPVRDRALAHWRDEGIPVRPDGRGAEMATTRADLQELAQAHAAACADLVAPDEVSSTTPDRA